MAVAVRIVGTEQEIQGFIRALDYEDELVAISSGPIEEITSEELGAGELVQMVVEFAVGIGAQATYERVGEVFKRYRGDRRHMQIERTEEQDEQPQRTE